MLLVWLRLLSKERALLKKVISRIKVGHLVPRHLDFLNHLFQTPFIITRSLVKSFIIRMKRKFNKNSNRWTVFQEKEKKKYDYVDAMLDDVIHKHNETQTTRCRTTLQPGDPRLIAPTIAPFQSPPTSVLVAEMKTRFT